MFEDFRSTASSSETRKHRRQSLAAAFILYGGLFGGMIAATATATTLAPEPEEPHLIFVPPPEPAPALAPPPPAPAAKPKSPHRAPVPRPKLTPPDKVTDDPLEESDAKLAADEAAGPEDGRLDGMPGSLGSGPPPAPPPKPVASSPRPPVALASNRIQPRYSSVARRKGIEGVVVVDFEVTAAGTVRDIRIVSGAPELVDMVLKWVPNWRFKPALKDGKAVPWRKTETIRFRLSDA